MRRLFILLVLVAAGLGALGFYQGWFSVKTETTPDGKSNTTLTVDHDKIKADEQKAEQKTKEKLAELKGKKDKALETSDKAP